MEQKKFFRTVAGKTILFIAINLFVIISILSIGIAVISVTEDLYATTESEFLSAKCEDDIRINAISDANTYLSGKYNRNGYLPLLVTDSTGKVWGASPEFDQAGKSAGKPGPYENYELRTYDTALMTDKDGNFLSLYTYHSIDEGEILDATVSVYVDPSDFMNPNTVANLAIHALFTFRYIAIPAAIISFLLALAGFIALMCVTGKKPGSEEIALGPVFKIPFDLLIAGFMLVLFFAVIVAGSASERLEIILSIFMIILILNMVLGLCVSLAARIKLHALIKGLLITKIILAIVKLIKLIIKGIISIPLIWRTVLALAVLSFIEFIFMAGSGFETDVILIGWFFEKLLIYPFIFYIAFLLKKLKNAGDKIASGDITYRASTKGMWGDFKKHALNLNSVSDSVTIAVEERLKSERMKTELITNVSHDIKTPLTSIINYASLIGSAEPSDPKLSEYSEVIVRQSDKLKKLIEDLVEASKASTGNIEIVPSPLDNCTFISQTAGEFKERLESCNLNLITSFPEDKVMIMADGRQMMRIYDNLMNNICKYSQPGTRVYVTLEVTDGKAVTVFKNTSSAELNISADELVERFVRGDSSRNTEGNGLGLSIAKSLTELQGGTFDIAIDGDLFKVTLSFPFIK